MYYSQHNSSLPLQIGDPTLALEGSHGSYQRDPAINTQA